MFPPFFFFAVTLDVNVCFNLLQSLWKMTLAKNASHGRRRGGMDYLRLHWSGRMLEIVNNDRLRKPFGVSNHPRYTQTSVVLISLPFIQQ